MHCPSCSTPAPPGARFCAECGVGLPQGCPACGAVIQAAGKFCGECGHRLTQAAPVQPPPPKPVAPFNAKAQPGPAGAERRLVSVLFCDLVGSTTLSTQIDLEDYREVIGAFHAAVAAEVERCSGFVAKYMGDGVLAYFGYPIAREDDAELAVRAGLAIAAAVERLSAPGGATLRARVGVATGPVIVGDLIGSGSAQERGISGETPNLSARLQGLADPGQLVICASTHTLTGRLFAYGDLGAVSLKGFAKPQHAYEVLAMNETVGRFEALRSSKTPLIGREEELELLQRRWERALAGEPQVVLISAEPGVGKSRLISAFREQLAGAPHGELAAYCAPHAAESAFYPIIRALEARCGFSSGDSPDVKLDKLQGFLRSMQADADPLAGALIGGLLSLPVEGVYPAVDLSPQRIKDETIRVLTPLMITGRPAEATLTVVEDIHWADPTSLELLRSAVRHGGGGAPQLLLITFRPEFHPPLEWLGRPDVSNLTLTRLRPADAEAMVRRMAEGRRIAEPVLREILQRAEGVPLFVEEITRSVMDAEEIAEGDGSQARIVVPATLQASLVGRLDRLGPVKELAQVGAAIGREFGAALLQAVVEWPSERLEEGLDQLIEADVIFPSKGGGGRAYIFKHALVQDVAYGALLRGPRQTLHSRIADAMTSTMPEEVAVRPELIARHLAEAGRPRESLPAWRRAALRSFASGSWRECLSQLRQAMQALSTLPQDEERDRIELDLQMITAGISQGTIGHSAPDAQMAYERAYALARSLGDHRAIALAGARLWIGAYGQGDLDGVIHRMEQVLAELPADADDYDRALVSGQMTTPYSFIGDFIKTKALVEETEAGLQGNLDPAPPEYQYMSPLTSPLNSLLVSLLAMGMWVSWSDLNRRFRRELTGYPMMSRVITLTMMIYSDYIYEDWEQALENVRLMSTTVDAMEGSIYYLELGRMIEIRMASRAGDRTAAAQIDEVVERPSVAFAKQHIPRYMMIAGDVHADLGDTAKARAYYAEALKGGPFGTQRWLHSEIERRMGEIAVRDGDATAQDWFEQAMATARAQNAILFELRAAMRLCELQRAADPRFDPAPLLAPLCDRFPEPSPELDAARAMVAAAVAT